MADDAFANGVDSISDSIADRSPIKGRDRASDLERELSALNEERSALLREREDRDEKIGRLELELDGFRRSQAEMEGKLAEMRGEIHGSEEDKKALKAVAARAAELETEVSRLQHDFQNSMLESSDAAAEVRRLERDCEELRRSNEEKAARIGALEKERSDAIERADSLRAEMGDQIRGLQEKLRNLASDVEKLEREKGEAIALNSSLEARLSQSEAKVKAAEKAAEELGHKNSEMEVKLMAQTTDKVAMEKKILALERELEEEDDDDEVKGFTNEEEKDFRYGWPVAAAAASTGTIAAAVAMLYLRSSRQRILNLIQYNSCQL